MLELVGERGYREVTIGEVLGRSGSNRSQFYAAFKSKDACLEAAYADALDALLERLLGRGQEVPWARRVRNALEDLAEFVADDPALARGIFSGARLAGNGVEIKRRDAIERLTEAVDAARGEIGSRPAPPPIAARFLVGVVEAAVLQYLAEPEGRDFGAEIRDVLYMAVDVYLGPEAAQAEVDAFEPGEGSRKDENI